MGWRIALWTLAAVAAVLPRSGGLVERWYSNGLFPPLQRLLTSASNLVPFALFDLLVLLLAGGVLIATLRDALQLIAEKDHGVVVLLRPEETARDLMKAVGSLGRSEEEILGQVMSEVHNQLTRDRGLGMESGDQSIKTELLE